MSLAWWFVFNEAKLLVNPADAAKPVPLVENIQEIGLQLNSRVIHLGLIDNIPCYAAITADTTCSLTSYTWQTIRECGANLADDFFNMACRAWHLLQWDIHQIYCSQCKSKLEIKLDEQAKLCPSCQTLYYPRISPSVMVLVKRKDKLLLARSPHFRPGVYSALAGFVEPGEALETTAVREVLEETGIKIKNLKYFGSQPWPFPDSLMLAFTAEYDGGEIQIDPKEIEDAQWFSTQQLPPLPSPASIAYRLIQSQL